MNKIFVLAGIIFLLVLLLSAWVFIGNLGDFAKFLGKKSINAVENEKTRFVGTWITDNYDDIYVFKIDGSAIVNNYPGNYLINENETIDIRYQLDDEFTSFIYSYYFLENDTQLNLKNMDNFNENFTLIKQ